MKKTAFLFCLYLISCQHEEKPAIADFKIFTYYLKDTATLAAFEQWRTLNLKLPDNKLTGILYSADSIPVGDLCYFDDEYNVYGYCAGEFGGALMFQDKQIKDSVYYLGSTCPVMIDRRQDGYYITTSLSHLSGAGRVQFLSTPKQLVNVHKDSLNTDWQHTKFPGMDKFDIWVKLEEQGTVLFDTIGLTIDLVFPYNNRNYLIFSKYNCTGIGYLDSNRLIVLDTLFHQHSWNYSSFSVGLNKKSNGFYHYNFRDHTNKMFNKGDIYVRNDTVVIALRN